MMVISETVDVLGPDGPIRCLVVKPAGASEGARLPAVLSYPDIFQLTPPTVRLAERLASYGFLVVVPELYGRIEPLGTVLDFEADRQRALDDSARMTVEQLDADTKAVLAAVAGRADVDAARLFALGFCFGGHLAFRAAFAPEIKATACCYPTGVHNGTLGASTAVGTLERVSEIGGELLLVWGRQDPHIPAEGRARIHRTLDEVGVRFEARLFDAAHAFMRDVGPRWDPECTDRAFAAIVALFRQTS